MKTVHKYELYPEGTATITLPIGAQILSVQVQRDAPYMWVLLDTEVEQEDRTFKVYGTGQSIPNDLELKHLGTVLSYNGALVLHVFEMIK